MSRSPRVLLALSLLFISVWSASIDGLYPDAGPTDGSTRVTVYSSSFKGLNYSSHPTPKCQFEDHATPQPASWIHCSGTDLSASSERSQTCLNCESPPHSSAGNASLKVSIKGDFTDTLTTSFHYYTPPVVTWATPFIGRKHGGTFVTIHGSNFENLPALGCVFGTIIVPATFVSSSVLTCLSPPSDAVDTPIPLKITQNVQQATQTTIQYYYYSIPEISELVPNSGPTSGGTHVYIKGRQMYPFQTSNLDIANTTFVRFGEKKVKGTLMNTTHSEVYSPAVMYEGPAIVEITFNDQEWTDNGIPFYYYLPPYVLEIIPSFGPLEGKTNVTVIGANFHDSKEIKCRFGDKVVEGHFIDEVKVWCLTPSATQSGYVPFSLALTQDRFSGNDIKYLYVDPPVVSSITPPCGPTTGFTQIAVRGKNFIYIGKDKSLCVFDDKYQQPATVFNDTLIYCDSPPVVDKLGNNVLNIKSLSLKITLNQVDYVSANTNFSYYTMPLVSSISPMNGPLYGGTNIVVESTEVKDFCALTCRFGTMEVPGHLNSEGKVSCASPIATCAGKTVAQISLNGQQYTNNYYDVHPSIFYYYPNLILSYVQPDSVPTSGGSIITIYGEGYLMSRNTTISTSTGVVMISYDCQFSSESTIHGTTTAVYVDNNIIKCPTPPISTPTNGVLLKVSPNGQNWHPVHVSRINFYRAPEISDISPKFGKIKQKNTTLNVYGSNFDCPNNQCTDVKCSFNTPDMSIITEGTRESSSLIICQIPPISRPEVTIVQVSLNGIDYTNSNATYTFYDAFVLAVDPPYVPVEGHTTVRLIGYGFADTQQIKVKLQDSNTGQALSCSGSPCILPATFISQSEIQFTAPPQSTVTDATGNSIAFKRFVVEASVYEDSYTNNGIEIQYFEQPIVGKLTADGTPKVLHANTLETIRTPVTIKVPAGTSRTSFLNFAKIRCKFHTGGEPIVTVGIIVNYPFPSNATGISDDYSRIECPTPKFENEGTGDVSVSLNGRDFVGSNPILVKPELKLLSVAPTCGPKEGGTETIMTVQGFGNEDIENLFFSWSTVCTSVFTQDLWSPPNTLSTITPPVERVTESPGGTSLVVYSLHRKTQFTNDTTVSTVQHYLDSSAEFLFFVQPIVIHVHPHSGRGLGGTPVILEGAFFFSDKQHGCTPKCKFGDLIVEAEFLSTVRLRCSAPAGTEGLTVPVTVTMNGHDSTPSHPDQTYTFTSPPVIHSIHPSSGPSSGGTPIMVVGVKYVDLSTYPDEFLCVFTSTKTQQVKKTPANYLNDTTIMCTSPGGWGAGSIATVQITYNGVDLSNNNNTFRFYQVDSIFPLSGPSSGGTPILIKGSGFDTLENGGNAACKINNQISKATFTNWSQIICTAPPAQLGPSFKEHVDFYYTLDGKDWHRIHKGFTYYPQPSVSEIIPGFIAQDGGTIEVNGEGFLDNYYETHLSCKIGNTVGVATYVNETHAKCTFPAIDVGKQAEHHLQMSLNDVTYTTLGKGSKINVFYVTKMTPTSGIVQGGTQITVEGQDFPEGKTPLCRFGARTGSTITFGTPVSTSQVVCTSPAADLPANAELPFEVMFSLTFEDDTYNLWEYQGLYYYYYEQPVVEAINPRSALLDQASTIVISSTTENLFGDAVIGSKVTTDSKTLDHNIQCRFGRFGTTKGALLDNNKISCPTPNTKLNLEEIGEEPVKMEVAMNGQDFTSTSSVYFKFVGSKSPSSYGIAWMIAILIGTIVLVFLIYFIVKAFRQGSGVGTNSLNKPYNDQQRLSPNRPSQGIPL